jgi:hypothetical protein
MITLHKQPSGRKAELCPLPLFDWAASQPPCSYLCLGEQLTQEVDLSVSRVLTLAAASVPSGRPHMGDVIQIKVTVDSSPARRFRGRFAWALHELIQAAEGGCTSIERPAPRWSHYVWWLRRKGISIETITEKHGGPYAGTHARYVLRSSIELHQVKRTGEKRHAV